MKKACFVICFSFFISIASSTVFAQSSATTYKITVQSIQLKRSSDSVWVTVASPNQEIDIASVNAGSTAASLLSNSAIPVGSYDNFRIRCSETITASGTDSGNSTSSSGAVSIDGTGASSASTSTWGGWPPPASVVETANSISGGAEGETTYTLNLDNGDADNYFDVEASSDLSTPITITGTSVVTMSFDFDTGGTILFLNNAGVTGGGGTDVGGDGAMIFSPPQSGTQFQITVDGTTTTISEANMVFNF